MCRNSNNSPAIEIDSSRINYSKSQIDSIKVRATNFIISNMPSHHYRSEQSELYSALDSLNRAYRSTYRENFWEYRPEYDSLVANVYVSETVDYKDTETLSDDFLVSHIDSVFAVFERSPWRKYLKFSDFCEYLLPYNIANEKRELWIEAYRRRYGQYFDAAFERYYAKDTTLSSVVNQIRTDLDVNREIAVLATNPEYPWLGSYPPVALTNILWGSCENAAFMMTFIFRSAGIPATVDHAPQWGSYSLGHSWNVVADETGKMLPCDRETNIGNWQIDERIDPPKIYRHVYSIDRQREKAIAKARNFVPELFGKNLRDVTSEYVPVSDVSLKAKDNLMYLCVFDNRNWKAVAMGFKTGGKAVFKDMGRRVVYLPAYYRGDELFSSDFPFILDSLGQVHKLEPDLQNSQTLKLTRKFHSRRVGSYYNRMLGGRFQGSNSADFSDATTLYEITEIPPLWFQEINVGALRATPQPATQFRYFRYIGGKNSWANIAEMEVYGSENKKLFGTIIGSPSSDLPADSARTKQTVFDSDGLTYFKALADSGGWVGLDFGQPQSISKIRYLPRNDDNNIRRGDDYELFFWSAKGWESLGLQRGNDTGALIFERCPSNALFWLHNLTRGREERIFTVEDGEVRWW
jgi:hypothetical protein